jgi:hypothetical protein
VNCTNEYVNIYEVRGEKRNAMRSRWGDQARMRLLSNGIVCEWETCNVISNRQGKEVCILGRLDRGEMGEMGEMGEIGSLKKEKRNIQSVVEMVRIREIRLQLQEL